MTYLVPTNTKMTTRIGVPTLRIVGERDRVICNPDPCMQRWLDETTPAQFPAGVEAYAQPGAPHNIALEQGNTGGFHAALRWLQRHFPVGPSLRSSLGTGDGPPHRATARRSEDSWTTPSAWFAARPSRTEDVDKI
jgi:hypothetical protein